MGPHPSYAIRDRIVAGRTARNPLGSESHSHTLGGTQQSPLLSPTTIAGRLDSKMTKGIKAAIDMAARSIGEEATRRR